MPAETARTPPAVLAILRFLYYGVSYSFVGAVLCSVLAIGYWPLLFVAMGLMAFSFGAFLASALLIMVFYVRYSLKTLLGFFIAFNLCIVFILSQKFLLVAIGVPGIVILVTFLLLCVLNFDPMLAAADFPKYVKSASNGVVKRILVNHGEVVVAGQKLLVLQSSDQEYAVDSDYNATVESIDVRPGQSVAAGMVLGVLKTG